MPYTDLQVKKIKAGPKRLKVSVGSSLFVVIEPTHKAKDSKSFVGMTRFRGKQIEVRIGPYGSSAGKWSLKDARDEWERLKKWSKENGRDPRQLQKQEKKLFIEKATNPTLIDACNGWLKRIQIAPSTRKDYENKLDNQILNVLGRDTPMMAFNWANGGRDKVLNLKEAIEARGSGSQADRVLMVMRQVFEYAMDRGWMDPPNPAQSSRLAKSQHKVKHNPYLSWDELPQFISDLNENKINSSFVVVSAIKLALLTFQRVGSLVPMRFEELDYTENFWTIPAGRMKSREEHYVPLTDAIKEVIDRLGELNGHQEYVFFSPRRRSTEHITPSSLNICLKNMGYGKRQTAHGIRSLALTFGTEELGFDKQIIRRQMAHLIGDKTERSYLHAQFFKERRQFMDAWCNALVDMGLKV